MENNKPSQRPSRLGTPFIRFLGGVNLLFLLTTLLLTGAILYMIPSISFIFAPISILIVSILTPFVLGLVFYYLLVPLVDFLETKNISRSIGATISLLLLFFVLFLGIGYAIPVITSQLTAFFRALPSLINSVSILLQNLSSNSQYQSYYLQIADWLNGSFSTIVQQVLNTLMTTLQGITNIIATVSSVLMSLLVFPIFLFFMLTDGRAFKNAFLKAFPFKVRDEVNEISLAINQQVGAYIKGRLLTSMCMGVYFYLLFSLIGLDYAFVLSLLAAILSLIPYVGSLIALIPTAIVALTNSTWMLLQVLIIWGLGQILDGNIIGPKIIGTSLKMHPLTIIVVLMVAGNALGIVGMIAGIPLYAIIRVFCSSLFKRFKNRYDRYFDSPYDSENE